MQIPKEAEQIIERLNKAGFEAYVVGGCVRDTLLGKTPEDWDITTSAKPEQVKAIFGRTIDTGIQHGTVTIMKGKTGYEVTTYRIDGEYEDGRHPKSVAYTSDLVEDLKRRDFTINAMAYNHEIGLVDVFEGMQDLECHKVRCVGDPMQRFLEDALRILRAIRFSAQLGFEIDPATKAAITVNAPNLAQVSKERILAELTKLLLSDHPQQISMVYETGISPYISPAFDRIRTGHPTGCQTEAVDQTGSGFENPQLPPEKSLRWASFLHEISAKEAVQILKDLKADGDTIAKVKILVEYGKTPIAANKTEIRRVMSGMTPELYDRLLLLKRSLGGQAQAEGSMPSAYAEDLDAIEALSTEIRRDGDCVSKKALAVTGNDLIQSGMKPGQEMGET
ncbi:MAG: CCA tRNA nucleotidyltransferase, partial [Hungatella sp.]